MTASTAAGVTSVPAPGGQRARSAELLQRAPALPHFLASKLSTCCSSFILAAAGAKPDVAQIGVEFGPVRALGQLAQGLELGLGFQRQCLLEPLPCPRPGAADELQRSGAGASIRRRVYCQPWASCCPRQTGRSPWRVPARCTPWPASAAQSRAPARARRRQRAPWRSAPAVARAARRASNICSREQFSSSALAHCDQVGQAGRMQQRPGRCCADPDMLAPPTSGRVSSCSSLSRSSCSASVLSLTCSRSARGGIAFACGLSASWDGPRSRYCSSSIRSVQDCTSSMGIVAVAVRRSACAATATGFP